MNICREEDRKYVEYAQKHHISIEYAKFSLSLNEMADELEKPSTPRRTREDDVDGLFVSAVAMD